jgi:HAD superfamily hydrolase (TIGR01509 family)
MGTKGTGTNPRSEVLGEHKKRFLQQEQGNSTMIKTALFDLGNVLLLFKEDIFFERICEAFNIATYDRAREIFNHDLRMRYEKGVLSTEEFCDSLREATQCNVPSDKIQNAMSHIFTLNEDIIPIVKSLREKGIRLVLLSNISEMHHNHIKKHYDILDLFDDHVMSYIVGAAKPEDRIFLEAIEKAHCPAEECFYTDDIPEFVEAAKRHNINAHTYTSVNDLNSSLQALGLGLGV